MKYKTIFNKSLLLFMMAVIFFSMLLPMSLNAATSLKTGDYVQFGSYNSEPILWRVVNLDKNGPLLLSERILCLKSFDAPGSYHTESARKGYGSNYWKGSNIRQWLNSSESKIKWLQNAPSKKNLVNSVFTYESEKGFLAEGNFTTDERKAIKTVNRHVLLAKIDKKKAEGGRETHKSDGHIGQVIQNYDKAYYHTMADKVFFLNVKEVQNYLRDRGWEYRAFPTETIVLNTNFRRFDFSSLAYWNYWLDTPETQTAHEVRFVTNLGYLLETSAMSSACGVRPALYLDLQAMHFKSGLGSKGNPYIVDRGKVVVQQKAVPLSSSIKITINGKPLITDVTPFIRDGSILVPFKAIVSALGGYYSWDNENLMAMGGVGKTYVTLMTDSPLAVISKVRPDVQMVFALQEEFTLDNFGQYVESDQFIELDVAPTMKNQQMMVPVRFIAESLGAKVKIDDKNKTVTITTP